MNTFAFATFMVVIIAFSIFMGYWLWTVWMTRVRLMDEMMDEHYRRQGWSLPDWRIKQIERLQRKSRYRFRRP